MPRTLPRVVLAARTPAGRRQQRLGIRLRDFTIQAKTKDRYTRAVAQLLPYLESQADLSDLDGLVSDWVEAQWARGASVSDIADALSGLHFFWPEIRGLLRSAWRLLRSWRRIECPQRAPPLTILLIRAMVAHAIWRDNLQFAAMLCLGFHCLLRTGEMVLVQYQDLEFSLECGPHRLTRSCRHSRFFDIKIARYTVGSDRPLRCPESPELVILHFGENYVICRN